MLIRFAALLCLFFSFSHANAHDPFVAEIKGEATESQIVLKAILARPVAAHIAGLNRNPRAFYPAEQFPQDLGKFQSVSEQVVRLYVGDRLLEPSSVSVELHQDEDIDVAYIFSFARPATSTDAMRVESSWITRFPEGYTASFTLRSGPSLIAGPGLLNSEKPDFTFPLTASGSAASGAPTAQASAWEFYTLGIEHILTGYDHLLYLAALILGCMTLRGIAFIVTAFTIAHSITLALATLGIVTPPSALVEQIIAASIVFVALENLWLRGRDTRLRLFVSFGFGLIHGFGFAGVLNDMGVTAKSGGVIVPLLTFNLGVETGQLLVIAVTLPLLMLARRQPFFVKYLQPAGSAAVAAMGAYWLITRL